MINNDYNIGPNIAQVRREKGLSQAKLHELTGISTTTLSSYENSKKIPNVSTLSRIAIGLGVSLDRLYYGDPDNAFITSTPDVGRRVVNAIYLLWEQGVISIYNYWQIGYPPFSGERPNRLVLYVNNYDEQIQRLIMSLDEYKAKKSTFSDPDQYLESIKTSVANEINGLIKNDPLDMDDVVVKPQTKICK